MARWIAFEWHVIDRITASHRPGAERQAAAMWGRRVVELRAVGERSAALRGHYDVVVERAIGGIVAADRRRAEQAARYAWGARVARVQSVADLEVAATEYQPEEETL